jgi:hypothetical protein
MGFQPFDREWRTACDNRLDWLDFRSVHSRGIGFSPKLSTRVRARASVNPHLPAQSAGAVRAAESDAPQWLYRPAVAAYRASWAYTTGRSVRANAHPSTVVAVRTHNMTSCRSIFRPGFAYSFTFDDLAPFSRMSTHVTRANVSVFFTLVPQMRKLDRTIPDTSCGKSEG